MAELTKSMITVAALLAVQALQPARAQANASDAGIAEIERVFWVCDHQASRGLLDSGTAESCGRATELLKARRFGGDFQRLLVWWQQHKAEQHLALDQATAARRVAAERR
jgi:hypothetical protein